MIFSLTYIACLQDKFEKAFKENNLEEALSILNNFPPASEEDEKISRLFVMCQGYRAIAEKYVEIKRETEEEYTALGINEELRKKLKEIGTYDEIRKKVRKIRKT